MKQIAVIILLIMINGCSSNTPIPTINKRVHLKNCSVILKGKMHIKAYNKKYFLVKKSELKELLEKSKQCIRCNLFLNKEIEISNKRLDKWKKSQL